MISSTTTVRKPVAQRIKLTVKKNKLYIGEEDEDKVEYKKLITPQAPDHYLNLTEDENVRIRKIKIGEGSTIGKGQCRFIGYTKSVKSPEEIQDAYVKLRLLHPRA